MMENKPDPKYLEWLKKQDAKPTAKELRDIKVLEKKALSLWKQVVRASATNKCEMCGKTEKLQAHHIESYSTNKTMRYERHNGILLCTTCHKFGRLSAHKSFCSVYEFLTQKRPLSLSLLLQHYRDKTTLDKDKLEGSITHLLILQSLPREDLEWKVI